MRALKIGGSLLAWVILLGSFAPLGGFTAAQPLPEGAPLLPRTVTLPGPVTEPSNPAVIWPD